MFSLLDTLGLAGAACLLGFALGVAFGAWLIGRHAVNILSTIVESADGDRDH